MCSNHYLLTSKCGLHCVILDNSRADKNVTNIKKCMYINNVSESLMLYNEVQNPRHCVCHHISCNHNLLPKRNVELM